MFTWNKWLGSQEIVIVLGLILGALIFASVLFFVWGRVKPEADLRELKQRTKSWWIMAGVFVLAISLSPLVTYVALGFLSFIALRELVSISKNVRDADRNVLVWGYLAIPVQYYIAYKGWYTLFLTFIPIFMFIWIPFMLVVRGETDGIARSFAILPTHLMICVFSISHLAFLLSLPPLPGFEPSGRGLLLFVVLLTEANDIFQFIWGKALGRHKVAPKVSPNKTWEGLIGGVLSTTVLGFFVRFLTPLTPLQAVLVSAVLGMAGFIGDVVISAVKRDFGLKDTGQAIPGHGGILDRIDSLAITGPVFFHLVYRLAYA